MTGSARAFDDRKIQPLLGEGLAEIVEVRIADEVGDKLTGVVRITENALPREFPEVDSSGGDIQRKKASRVAKSKSSESASCCR